MSEIELGTIGFIGLGWKASSEYIDLFHEIVTSKLGGRHCAKLITITPDFEEIAQLQEKNNWEELTKLWIKYANHLDAFGADCVVIGANTMHRPVEEMRKCVKIPILHIADALAERVVECGLKKVGLLGTKFTMESEYYKNIFETNGIEIITPNDEDKQVVNQIIYEELTALKITDGAKEKFHKIITNLIGLGAEGIILGCADFPLLTKGMVFKVPLFNTTEIHCKKAVDFVMKNK